MSTGAHERRGLCLLSLDAGGLRAISQLRILISVMDRLDPEASGGQTGLPCAIFDMIGGTGSGGFIAILLVILGMNARKALEEFEGLCTKVLEKAGMTAQARTAELKSHIHDLLGRHKFAPDTNLLESSGRSADCKLAVPISYKYDAGSTCTLRNFKVRDEQALNITIAEALLVTLATPPLFTPTSIFKDASTFEYIGGDLALSNPTQEVIYEAQRAFGSEERVACLLSLGCGHPGVVATPNNPDMVTWNHFLGQLVSHSERKAQSIGSQMSHLHIYYRFSVPTGLERSRPMVNKEIEEIVAHTTIYLEDVAILPKVAACVDTLGVRAGFPSLEQLNYYGGERILPAALPPLTSTFVMRKKPWDFIEKVILGANNPTEVIGSRVLVVTGMGGCGKTQLVLKFMLEHQEKFVSQFFVDSSSKARLRADIVRHVRSLGPEHSQSTFQDCLLFLSRPSLNGPRLILYDNVDDPNLELAPLLPRGKSCVIVITSRDRLIGELSPNGHLELDVMHIDEAIDLLLHDTAEVTNQAREEARDIADALGCLPLALQQARSYMFQTKCSARAYLQKLGTSRDNLLSGTLKNRLDGSPISTYAAFNASFEKLAPRVQRLLRILSFFHWGDFPLELIILAASYHFNDYETKYVDHGDGFKTGKAMLEGTFMHEDIWNISNVDRMTTALQNYSLATVVPGVNTTLLQMHPLAHAWVRSYIPIEEQTRYQSAAVLLLALGARTSHTPSARYLASHATHMSRIWDQLNVNDAEAFALILRQGGSFEGSLQLRERVVAGLRRQIDAQSISFSGSLWLLAVSYSNLNRFAEAELLQAEVMNLRRGLLAEGDITGLSAASSLANTHRHQRRFDAAEALQLEVLKLRRDTQGKQHPDTIDALSQLALTYSDWRRFEEAEKLQVEALKLSKEARRTHHPDTLAISGHLASTYLNLGRPDDALQTQLEVVRLSKDMMGERHPETSNAMSQLARIHSALGEFHKAETIQEEVLRLSKEMRGDRDSVTITASSGLAMILYELGQFKEALAIQEEVLELRKELLGVAHLDTLTASSHLSKTYCRLGHTSKGEWLQEEVLRRRRALLGDSHPDTLAAATTLADTYLGRHKRDEAVTLLQSVANLTEISLGEDHPASIAAAYDSRIRTTHVKLKVHSVVLARRMRCLGKRHRDTITSMNNVAISYRDDGRIWRAKKMQLEVVELSKEVLGERDPDTIDACTDLVITYLSSGEHRKAERLQLEIVRILQETRGDRHPDTIGARERLAHIYYNTGRRREAKELEEELLVLKEAVSELRWDPPIEPRVPGKLQRLVFKGLYLADRLLLN